MAVLTVAEFRGVHREPDGFSIQAARMPPLRIQRFTFNATSSAVPLPFFPDATLIRVYSDTACFIKFGTGTPVASITADIPLPAAYPEYYGIDPSGAFRIAAVTA